MAVILVTACVVSGHSDVSEQMRESGSNGARAGLARQTLRSERELVLDALLADLLSNPRFEDNREFYGTSGDTRVALVSDSDAPWPGGYEPSVSGYGFYYTSLAQRDPSSPRVLGIMLYHFEFPPKPDMPPDPVHDWPVTVCLFNAGGAANGGADGGCLVYYSFKRSQRGWQVEFQGKHRP